MPPKSPNCYAAENNPKGPYISTVLAAGATRLAPSATHALDGLS